MIRKVFLTALLAGVFLYTAGAPPAKAAPSLDQRIPQTIIVNGQYVQGVTVVRNGAVQRFTCTDPQQFVTADQAASGWACFDANTGTWLLNAVPPQSATVYQSPPAYYDVPAYGYYGYPYGYPYGYYGYPFYGFGPAFGFGFGFGGYGHHFEGHNEHFGHGGFGHGGFGHGGFGHAPMAHGGGGFHGGGFHGGGFHGGGGHMGGGGHR